MIIQNVKNYIGTTLFAFIFLSAEFFFYAVIIQKLLPVAESFVNYQQINFFTPLASIEFYIGYITLGLVLAVYLYIVQVMRSGDADSIDFSKFLRLLTVPLFLLAILRVFNTTNLFTLPIQSYLLTPMQTLPFVLVLYGHLWRIYREEVSRSPFQIYRDIKNENLSSEEIQSIYDKFKGSSPQGYVVLTLQENPKRGIYRIIQVLLFCLIFAEATVLFENIFAFVGIKNITYFAIATMVIKIFGDWSAKSQLRRAI